MARVVSSVIDTVTSPIRATARLIMGDKPIKAAVVGAAGGIGQPLSLLLKLSPYVSELSLFDVAPFTPGTKISHMFTFVTAVAPELESVLVPSGAMQLLCASHALPNPPQAARMCAVHPAGVGVDLSHANTSCKVNARSARRARRTPRPSTKPSRIATSSSSLRACRASQE